MKNHKVTLALLMASLFCLILYHLSPYYPSWIEHYFSRGLNHYFVQCLSHLTGWLPFSLLELGIFTLTIYTLIHIVYGIRGILKFPNTCKKQLIHCFIHTLQLICILWISFFLGWGLNYSRQDLEVTLNLKASETPREDLVNLYAYLTTQANNLRPHVSEDAKGYMIIDGGFSSVKERTSTAYHELSKRYSLFSGSYGKPKFLLISPLMNYTGITGIYSPFTAEANINIAILDQSLPVTMLHEMAHQRGFAKEAECNFIAFLACQAHPDADFKYSGYLLAIAYTSQALAKVDYHSLLTLNSRLSQEVMLDITHNNTFWQQYEGPIEKTSSSVNNSYLKVNGVESGTANYGEVVNLLLSYYVTYLKP